MSSTGCKSSSSPSFRTAAPDRDHLLGIESKADVVVRMVQRLPGDKPLGRTVELNHDLRRSLRQVFAGSDQDRHTGPAPRVDLQSHRGERLDLGVGATPFSWR